MWLVDKALLMLLWLSLAMLVLGSVGALVHSLESKRIGWFLSFFCIPGTTLLYALIYSGEAKPQWFLVKYGFCGLLVASIPMVIIAAGALPAKV